MPKELLNRPLKELDRAYIRKHIKAVTFDIDGVVVPVGTRIKEDGTGTNLVIKTNPLSPKMISLILELKKYLYINFSSGRALLYLQNFLGEILWDKVSICGENGNFILMNGKVRQIISYDEKYFQKIANIKEEIKKLAKKRRGLILGFEPKHVILTVFTKGPVLEIEKIVKKYDRKRELYCLWSGEGYDIGHKKTSKATALKYVCKALRINPKEMITTGNNLNDKEMLEFGIGVSVDPKRVSAAYAIEKKRGILGGEVIAKHLLNAFRK